MKKILSLIRFGSVTLAKGGLPFGSPVANIIEHYTKKDLATGEPIINPTNWAYVVLKCVGAAIMLYLLSKGLIDTKVILDFIKNMA